MAYSKAKLKINGDKSSVSDHSD